ncbi:hypothetical protein HPB50_026691 [Hyalomma asiaticum]|uniref:Uncharacterized protein n=1 Tax=Hyalomma asiaticum TaxID=266040 RepID=A0ACB7TP88_HYAAI|nr:hypothetical protein HPB50_026691 [Hyalomma asiaticum]
MVTCSVVGCSNHSDSRGRKEQPTNTGYSEYRKLLKNAQREPSKGLVGAHKTGQLERREPQRSCVWIALRDIRIQTAPSPPLGYGFKHASAARHERAEKRRHETRRAQAEERRAQADVVNAADAATVPALQMDAADAPSSPRPAEAADERASVQMDMTVSNIEALEKECVHLNKPSTLRELKKNNWR